MKLEGSISATQDRSRSAHATIRGYLYQTCLGVLRWIDLKPGEILVCEGDEDLDRHILGGGSAFEQVKAYSGGLGLADKAVVESLRQFLRSYTTLRPEGQERRFLFTTTAYRKRSRKGGLDFDLLKAWQEGDRRPEVCAAVRSIVLGDGPSPTWLAEYVAWLDAEPEGWSDSVAWTFEAPDLDKVRGEIRSRLAASPTTRLLPSETFLDRLVTEVLEASSRPAVRDRLLTREDLSRRAEAARAELGNWERSEPADRLRKVFDELARIGPLLHEEALLATDEAARIFISLFQRYPDAFRLRMTICIGNYRRAAEAAGLEPDEQLLQPIEEVLAARNVPDPEKPGDAAPATPRNMPPGS